MSVRIIRFKTLALTLLLSTAWQSMEARELRVGYGGSQPFIDTSRETASGVAVDIWQEANRKTGFRSKQVATGSVSEMLSLLESGRIDVVVGPISITEERYQKFGFTHPFYVTSPAILTNRSDTSFWKMIQPFLSGPFLIGVTTLLGLLLIVGAIIWTVENKANDAWSRDPIKGIGQGIWFAIVTFTTVGYGDLVPVGKRGRVLAGIWMVTAMITASSLTAGIASAFTLFQLQHAAIQGPSDLTGRTVAVIPGSSGEDFARRYSRRIRSVEDVDQAVDLVRKGEVDAFVYDYPVLNHLLDSEPDLRLVRSHDLSEHYCFVFRSGDNAVGSVDAALLQIRENGSLRQILQRWGLDTERNN
ncbi:MAG: transporter substrate-binding domain-containing protein [Leptospiraceae bacterium]